MCRSVCLPSAKYQTDFVRSDNKMSGNAPVVDSLAALDKCNIDWML